MSLLETYLICAAGVAVSVLFPVVSKAVRGYFPGQSAYQTTAAASGPPSLFEILSPIWEILKPYLVLAIFSLMGAAIVVIFLGNALTDWRAAFLAGYAVDSTIQKIKG